MRKIFLALDVTDESLMEAVKTGADMIITHHPLIFSGIKKVTTDNFIGRRIIGLIENRISYYAMHTNFDVLGMADLSAEYLELVKREILEVTYDRKVKEKALQGWKSRQTSDTGSFRQICKGKILPAFCKDLRRSGENSKEGRRLHRLRKKSHVCCTPGRRRCVCYGRYGLSFSIDAVAQGVCVIDGRPLRTEYISMDYMEKELREILPELEIEKMKVQHPCKAI